MKASIAPQELAAIAYKDDGIRSIANRPTGSIDGMPKEIRIQEDEKRLRDEAKKIRLFARNRKKAEKA